MIRKKIRPGTILFCLIVLGGNLPALEKTIELGKEGSWSQMLSFDGVTRTAGRWGLDDLCLDMDEYPGDGETEFLFHFNRPGESDAAGAYRFASSAPAVTSDVSALGTGSAVYQAANDGTLIAIPSGSLFTPGAAWGDFTLEFWLYPAALTQSETILSWKGAEKEGGQIAPQSLTASLRDRRIVWEFNNLFTLPDGRRVSVALEGLSRLLPRSWRHHTLRCDSSLGLLEYLLDGIPEAVVHVTSTGREGGSVAVARIGDGFPGELVIAPAFSGFMDELRLTRRYEESPSIRRFPGKSGTAVSKIIDLGYTGTRISRITSIYTAPGDSSVAFYYKVSDAWTGPRTLAARTDWIPFDPSKDFPDTVRGRYVQVMVELFPNGMRSVTPRVSSLSVVYEPNLPPTPPAAVIASAGNGKITVTWRKVNDLNVKGYKVYFGDAPHTYLNPGSPLDAGSATRIELTGLENGKLYYIAVTAYDGSDPAQESEFSSETSARPSRIYK